MRIARRVFSIAVWPTENAVARRFSRTARFCAFGAELPEPGSFTCDKLEADLKLGAVLNDSNQMSCRVAKVRRVAVLGQGRRFSCSLLSLPRACSGDYLPISKRSRLWVLTRKPDDVWSMQFLRAFRRGLERLGPYPSLVVLAIPLVGVEPLKLIAVLVAGGGHFLTGMIFLIGAYAVSLFVTERLFIILKPKLLMLPWFAKSWRWFVALRRRVLRWLRSLWTPAGKFLFGR